MISKEDIASVIKKIKDPELNIDLWTLGLIYDVQISEEDEVSITMTYTTPLCPYGGEMKQQIEAAIQVLNPKTLKVEVTFDPPWQPPKGLREMLGV